MALSDLKFEESDFVNQDISSLPDKVSGQAAFLKAKFDNVGKNLLALGRFNQLIDAVSLCSLKYNIGTYRTLTAAEGAVTLYLNNSVWSKGESPPSYIGNGQFKINAAGVYRITVNIGFINGDANTDRSVYLNKNAARLCGVSTKSLASTAVTAYVSLATEESLALNDVLDVSARVWGADSTVQGYASNSISITKMIE